MPFTQQSDLYAAIHEEGINHVVRHLMRQRPSLFNYATAAVRAEPELLCEPIVTAPGVTRTLTVQEPLPLVGAPGLALNYALQLTDAEIDFHPGNVISLPSQLGRRLRPQRFALRLRACAGLGCPSRRLRPNLDGLFDATRVSTFQLRRQQRRFGGATPVAGGRGAAIGHVLDRDDLLVDPGIFVDPPVHVFPTDRLECFCLELFATGSADFAGARGSQQVRVRIDDVEIVDIAPVGLENSLECYLHLVVQHVVLPQLNDAVSEVLFSMIELGSLGSLTLSASTAVPNNPAIEDDQLKAFLDLDDFELTIPPIVVSAGDDDEGGGGPEITRTERARTRTGDFHVTGAVSEDTFVREFHELQEQTTFVIDVEPQEIFGPLTIGADIRFHLENGDIDFQSNNTVSIDELDIDWDKLDVSFGIDLPELCLPKICIPFTDICTPSACIFSGDPDVAFTLAIPAVFTSEVSANLRPRVFYGVGPPNKWMVFLEPIGPVDVDLVDVADTVGDVLDDALDAAIDALGLPEWAGDLFGGPIIDGIRAILDIGDDVGEWLADLVFGTLGLSLSIEELVAEWLLSDAPIFELDDPAEILPAEGGLIPVRLPLEYLSARVDATELILEADVEAPA